MTPLAALAWPVVIMLLGLLAALCLLFAWAFWRQPEIIGPVMASFAQSHAIIRLAGVLVIVPAICALGLSDKISGEAAITAISAIAGYVLAAWPAAKG